MVDCSSNVTCCILLMKEECRIRRKKKEEMPTMKEILRLSGDKETYGWVCCKFMKCVIGADNWKSNCFRRTMSEFVTNSDESFLLLILENNYGRWMEEARRGANRKEDDDERNEGGEDTLPEALYTNSGNSKAEGKGCSRRFQGWSMEGYRRFNRLHELVRNDRRGRASFEQDQKRILEELNTKTGGGEDSDEEEEEELFPANDWKNVRQPPPTCEEGIEEEGDGEEEIDSEDDEEGQPVTDD